MSDVMKGHTFCEVSKKKAKKIFTDESLLESVMVVLNNEGKVFATREKKDVVCYYIFDRVQADRDEIMEEYYEQNEYLAKRKEKNPKHYAYKLVEEYFRPDKEHLRDVFEKSVRANLKEYLAWEMAKEIIWYDDVYVLEKGEKKVFNPAGIGIGMMFGVSFGISLDNMALAIPMGMMWAIVFSMIFNVDNKKLVKKGEQDATV